MKPSYTRVAGGNITPARFVTIDTATGKVTNSTSGDSVFGIAQQWTRRAPLSGWDDGYAAVDGESVEIYGPGDDSCLLALGGTVLPGQNIKASTGGVGVAATTDKDRVGAVALVGGVSGDLIRVKPVRFDVSV